MEKERKEIIIRMPNWIGDCIMAIPALKALSKQYSLTLAGKPWLAELFRGQTFFNRIIPFRSFLSKLPSAEVGILFTNSFSSAFNFFISGVKKRIGYSTDLRKPLLTDPLKPPGKIHQVLQYNRLAEYLIGKFNEDISLKIEKAQKDIDFIIIPGASKQAKRWRERRFRLLGEKLREKGFTVLYVGAKFEEELIKRAAGNIPFSTPQLGELPQLLARAKVVIGNDTGPIHLAAAVKTRVLVIFGPTDPSLTAPWGQENSIIYKKPECGPCHKSRCSSSKHICMNSIKVEEVFERAVNILKRKPQHR